MSDVKPFFVPRPGLIHASVWTRLVDEDWEDLGEYVDDWDYRSVLRLRSTLDTDVAAVRSAARLEDGSPLAWSVGWRATDSGLVGEPTIVSVSSGSTQLELDVPAQSAGAEIALTRRLILRRDRVAAAPGEARWAGSILWSDEVSVRLTGRGSAFPIAVVDFEERGLDPSVSWYLHLPVSPDLPAMGAMLLYINSADRALRGAVSRTRSHSDAQLALIQDMEEGVIEQLVRWALARWPDLDDGHDLDSVGAAARVLTCRLLREPAEWAGSHTDDMALMSAIVGGARRLGFGRVLS